MTVFKKFKNAKLLKIIEPEHKDSTIKVHPDNMLVVRENTAYGFKVDTVENPIQTRDEGEFAGKAFYLNNTFDWEFGYDSFGLIVLVPLKKGVADHG